MSTAIQKQYKQTEIGEIPQLWGLVPFADLLAGKVKNGLYKPKEFHGSGTKVINMGEIFSYDYIGSQDMQRIQLDNNEKANFVVRNGDLLFARRSLIAEGSGKCSLVIEHEEPITYESSIIMARPDKEEADPHYLLYYFQSPFGKYAIGSILRQVAVSGITGTDLMAVKVIKPPLSEQKAISDIVSTIDKKIQLNHTMNNTLELIGKTLFKRWFVDFEFPNSDGKPFKSNGGKVVESEVGKIPEGWKLGKLNELVDVLSGFAFSSSIYENNGIYGLVTIKNVLDGEFNQECSNKVTKIPSKMPNHCYLEDGDILLSLTGNVGRVCYVHSGEFLLNQRVAKLLPKMKVDTAFTYFLFRQDNLKSQLIGISKGTAQQNLSPVETAKLEILLPQREVLDMFSTKFSSLFEQLVANSNSSTKLSQLRKNLLPRLISGKLRVN